MKYIAVFCSANQLEEKYTKPAQTLARLLAEKGYHLVWGGSDKGLMKIIASEVQENGGKLIGVSIEHLKQDARKDADEMIIAKTLGERKATMLERSDAIVVLVGGIGTLDEVTEMLELKKHGMHTKPIVVLNTDNFYEGLKIQLEKMEKEGFLTKSLNDLIFFAQTPEDVFTHLEKSVDKQIIYCNNSYK